MMPIPEINTFFISDFNGGPNSSPISGEMQPHPCPTFSGNLPHLSPTFLRWPGSASVQAWLKACYNSPPKCPLFHRWPDSKWVRSERRTACLTVLLTLLRHLDPTTLCIGFLHSNGQFQNLAMKYIVLDTGLGQRPCERVISDFKKTQALEMKSPGHGQRPTLAFTPRFVEWMLWESSLWALEQGQPGDQSASGPDEGRP